MIEVQLDCHKAKVHVPCEFEPQTTAQHFGQFKLEEQGVC